jgi:phasin
MATAPKKNYVAAESASVAAEPTPVPAAPIADVAKMLQAPAASITDMQDKVRTMIEKGLAETRANYSKAKTVADEASSALETSFATAKTGVVEINVKALEALRASAEANFDFVKSILGAKTVADYVTLQGEFARKQIEMLTGQGKELGALARKVATNSVEPIKAQVAKTFKIAS